MEKNLNIVDRLIPGCDIESYIQSISKFAIFSPAEEKELAMKFYYYNDIEAARQLVLSHLRFVVHIAKSYTGYGLAVNDLIQEGNIGLMKAMKRFNPEVGVRLMSFAVHWIKAEIHEFILKNWRIVKVATTKAQRKLFFNLRSSKKSLSWFSNKEVHAVAKDLDVEPKVIREMEGRMTSKDTSYDGFQSDDNPADPIHYLDEESSKDPALLLETKDSCQSSSALLRGALAQLDSRSQDIINQRWLSEKKATLHNLADKYGVSAERIRQLEKNAMNQVKKSIEA